MARSTTEIKKSLMRIPGIGDKKAKDLMAAGVAGVADLHSSPYYEQLSDEAKFDLKYNVLRKIPLDLADRFAKCLPAWIYVLGSYRRKRPFLGDLDLVTTRPLNDVVGELKRLGVESGNFKIAGEFVSGELRRVIIINFENIYMKADLFYSAPDEIGAALLHWTGSVDFNTRVRAVAKRKGYLLNQYGLFKKGKKLPLNTEKDILEALNIKWKEPEDREK